MKLQEHHPTRHHQHLLNTTSVSVFITHSKQTRNEDKGSTWHLWGTLWVGVTIRSIKKYLVYVVCHSVGQVAWLLESQASCSFWVEETVLWLPLTWIRGSALSSSSTVLGVGTGLFITTR